MPADRIASTRPIYLCAPVNALVEGLYEENVSLSDIKRHGDFGLGTFDDLDGEMVMLDGNIYQITADGKVHSLGEEVHTPFAVVTFFEPTLSAETSGEMDYETFIRWLENLLPSPNLFYAIRITGTFSRITARSVPKQHNYRPLSEAAHDQNVFTFEGENGSLVGFFTPVFMGSLNVPGLHLHFLSADRQHGGHLLACHPEAITAEIQMIHTLELSLPMTHDYLTQNFVNDTTDALQKAETQS